MESIIGDIFNVLNEIKIYIDLFLNHMLLYNYVYSNVDTVALIKHFRIYFDFLKAILF